MILGTRPLADVSEHIPAKLISQNFALIYSILSSAVSQASSSIFIRVRLVGLQGEAHGSEDTDWCKRKSQSPKKGDNMEVAVSKTTWIGHILEAKA